MRGTRHYIEIRTISNMKVNPMATSAKKIEVMKPATQKAPVNKRPTRMKRIDGIIEKYDTDPKALLSILLDLHSEFNHLSKTAMIRVSKKLEIPLEDLYKIATSYKEFRFTPLKRHRIKVCRCSVCYVKGADRVLDSIERTLGIKPGETSDDGEYTLEVVNDLGLSPVGPCIMVDDNVYTKVTPKKAKEIFLKKELIWIMKPYDELAKGESSDKATKQIVDLLTDDRTVISVEGSGTAGDTST